MPNLLWFNRQHLSPLPLGVKERGSEGGWEEVARVGFGCTFFHIHTIRAETRKAGGVNRSGESFAAQSLTVDR